MIYISRDTKIEKPIRKYTAKDMIFFFALTSAIPSQLILIWRPQD